MTHLGWLGWCIINYNSLLVTSSFFGRLDSSLNISFDPNKSKKLHEPIFNKRKEKYFWKFYNCKI